MRVCVKCLGAKPVTEFSKKKTRRDGLETACRLCRAIDHKAWREANREAFLQGLRKRYHAKKDELKADPGFKKKSRESTKAWRESNPENWRLTLAAMASRHQEEIANGGTRTCVKCLSEKHVQSFAHGKRHLLRTCSTCRAPKARAYNEKQRDVINRRHRILYSKDPDKTVERIARRRGAPGAGFSSENWSQVLDEFGNRCAYCLKSGVTLTRDHVQPLVHGGSHDPSNIIPACRSCNSRKGKRGILCMVNQ
jgi:5-methylcytosine-specific restriction endonuclease McrA